MARSPVPPVTLLPPGGKPVELRRTGNELPSRAADNLYWLGRLVERAECNARLMRNILARLTSESDTGGVSELSILLRALAEQSPMEGLDPAQTPAQQVAAFELEMAEMVFRSTRAGSLRSTLDALSRAASVVRDRISSDTWRSLLRIDHDFRVAQPAEALQLSDVLVLLNQLVINLAAFSGLEMESMTRNQAWRFVDIGRRLERAMQTLGLLRATLTRQEETSGALLFAILDIADSSMTYRSRYLGTLQLGPVLDLLLTDETNPRSVAFQLNALSDHVEHLPRDHSKPSRTPEQRVMLASLTSLRMAEIDPLCEADKEGFRQSLDRLLGRLLGQLPTLSECLTHRYLVHSGTAGRLTEIRPSV